MSEKKVGKRLLTWVLVLVMTLSLLPLNVMAVEGDAAGDTNTDTKQSSETKGANLVKSATKNNDGTYTIKLESWVTGKVEQTTGSVPLDIVLVLDQSGSMSDKLETLKGAVRNFVNTVKTDAANNNVDHRIAIVGFARSGNDSRDNNAKWQNTGIFVNGEFKKYETYTDSGYYEVYELNQFNKYYIMQNGFFGEYTVEVSYNSEQRSWGYWEDRFFGEPTWKTVIPKENKDDTDYSHAQFYEWRKGGSQGLTEQDYKDALVSSNADSIDTAISNLAANGSTRASYGMEMANNVFKYNTTSNENRSRVVVFFTDGEPGYSGYENNEAGRAIAQANIAKKTYNAKVFSVGMFGDASENVTNFMNYVSSNYPDANASSDYWDDWTITSGDKVNDTYYMTANSTDLSKVFETISGSILTPSVEADGDTILTDTLSQYFTFGNDVTVDANGKVTGVTVEKVAYQGNNIWASSGTDITSTVGVDLTGKEVKVTGFDYSDKENVVTDGTTPSGYKLVVTFNVKPDTNCKAWGATGEYETNAGSATLGKDGSDPFATVASPKAPVETYQVTYTFDSNAPDGANLPEDRGYYISGQEATVKQPNPSSIEKDGYTYTFDGWKNGTDTAGETIHITGNVELVGTWTKNANTAAYTVNYLEKTTNKVLHEPKTVSNVAFEAVITSADEKINIDGYNYDSVDKDSLTIGTGENVINIYYTKRGDLSYTVNYLEKTTNKVLHEPKTVSNVAFEAVITSADEKINIDGYNYDSVDKDSLTIGTGENVINIYYTKKGSATFDFNDVDIGDGKSSHAITKTVTGNVGTSFTDKFEVIVTDALTGTSYTGTANVTYSDRTKVAFDFGTNSKLSFDATDVYTYKVQERKGTSSYMSYDTTEYTLTIRVELDKEANAYKVTSWYFTAGMTEYAVKTPLNITNTYYKPSYRPTTPTIEIPDDDALGLNTTDHFAYIVGYGNGEVRPQNNITRAEVATIFFRLLTDDVRDENLTKTNRYSDVTSADWYNTAVSTLSSMGIITGYPDGTFRPNAAITRAEFAAIAARFDLGGDKTAVKFSDIATHWARDEISIAYNNGWINGYPDGTFGPQRDITRAETVTLVNRVLNRQPETEKDLLPDMVTWTDNADKNAWYYLAVQEATNSHYYKFKTNSKYEKWTELRENRDWSQLEK